MPSTRYIYVLADVNSLVCACVVERVDSLETQTVKQLACGQMHTVGVTERGLVFAWGANTKGQIGIGNVENTIQNHPRCVH